MTLNRGAVLELLAQHDIRPSRALGQNFVADANTVRRIAALSEVGPGTGVIEIGAGLGSLTLALAETGAHVVAIEVDRRLVAVLRQSVSGHDVEVVEGDAMAIDFQTVTGGTGDWVLVANLPYNVAVPVVMRVLDDVPAVSRMLVMVQREVGERLAADAGGHVYGAVSVKVAYHATARVVGRVPPTVFVPRPRVESALVSIVRRSQVAVDPAMVSAERLFSVVRAGFGQRRKMLRRSLSGLVEPEAFVSAGIDPRARAEELSVEQWGRLAAWSG